MTSPQLYPLAASTNIGDGSVKIQIPTSPIHNERSKRTWTQLLNAVLRSDDQGPNIPSGKYTLEDNVPMSYLHNLPVIDDVLPTYDEVCLDTTSDVSKIVDVKMKDSGKITLSRQESADIVKSGQYDILGFNFGIEKTNLCKNTCVFTIPNALQTVITEEKIHPLGRPRVATL